MKMSDVAHATEDDRKLTLSLKALVDSGDWSALDKILDGLMPFVPTDTPEEALLRGRCVGVHVGFLNKVAPEVRERRSFRALIGRWQTGVDMLPVPGLRAEDLLGITRLDAS